MVRTQPNIERFARKQVALPNAKVGAESIDGPSSLSDKSMQAHFGFLELSLDRLQPVPARPSELLQKGLLASDVQAPKPLQSDGHLRR